MREPDRRSVEHPRGRWICGASGTTLDHAALMRGLARRQVVLLGETHDIAEVHRWQLHIVAALHGVRTDLAVGFEMFPRRLQPVLDRWVAGDFSTEEFLAEAEWSTVWGFPPELYLPLFHFCRQHRVKMLALNCRRALVTEVGKDGWGAIAEADRDGLTPARPASEAHRRHLFALVGGARSGAADAMDPRFDRFVRAQQTWDRAFACNIARAIGEDGRSPLVVGILGRGHAEFGFGTPEQLDDLGITDTAILLTTTEPAFLPSPERPIAEAVFRIDVVEPPARREEVVAR